MRASFDSNVWEELFHPSWRERQQSQAFEVIRDRLERQVITGCFCEAAFRIEAIQKIWRAKYLARCQPTFQAQRAALNGEGSVAMFSIGPNDCLHPGLATQQRPKVEQAIAHGFKLLRGQNWIFLPQPKFGNLPTQYVVETKEQASAREIVQAEVFHAIQQRGVGMSKLHELRERIDRRLGREHWGWSAFEHVADEPETKEVSLACSEWADAELVSAHLAYGNELLCTNDRAHAAKNSIFDRHNREWLQQEYGVRIVDVNELVKMLS